jgi:hypothetical protein
MNTKGEYSSWKRVTASLLATFSLPKDQDNSAKLSSSNDEYHDVPLKKTKARKRRSKMLSSAIQLVASIIKCDWDNLNTTMELLQNKSLSKRTTTNSHNRQQPKREHFFPDLLNVEELYYRISGASKHCRNLDDDFTANNNNTHANTSAVQFIDIPSEIVATSIAPYLRAKTLHALRVTNRKLNKSLRQVVPGLRLKLFQHQIRSLEWMEMRERRCVTEGDLLCEKSGGFGGEEVVCGGDYHRAVTGGATMLLAPRPCGYGTDTSCSLRFDAETGFKLPHLDSSKNTQTLCARGG